MSSTGIPGSKVVCLHAVAEFAYVIHKLKAIFDAVGGYDTSNFKPNATVEDLMNLPRCAVFVFASHGGPMRGHYCMQTGSLADAEADTDHIFRGSKHLWITERFMAQHWRFERDSFVFLHSCDSFNDEHSQGLRAAMRAVCGASVYGGWSRYCTGLAADDALWRLFDQLLGANQMPTSDSSLHPQRPFDLAPVMKYLRDTRQNPVRYEDEDTWSEMCTEPCGNGDFGLLAPSIHHLEIDEDANTLTLHGMFDQRPLRTRVFVKDCQSGAIGPDAHELALRSATDSEIVCADLPQRGRGAAGYVVVALDLGAERLLQSNPVPLTSWTGTFTYTIRSPAESSDNAIGTITAPVTVRGDVHKIRAYPGAPVALRPTSCGMVQDMDHAPSYTSGGTFRQSEPPYTYQWRGSGPLLPGFMRQGSGFASVSVVYNAPQPRLIVNMVTGEDEAVVSIWDEQNKLLVKDLSSPINVVYLGIAAHGHTLYVLDFLQSSITWDPGHDIPASDGICRPIEYPLVDSPGFTAELTWTAMTANYPPDQDTPA